MRSTSRTISSAASSVFASLLREARISAAPRIPPRGFFTSWATPAAMLPKAESASRSATTSWRLRWIVLSRRKITAPSIRPPSSKSGEAATSTARSESKRRSTRHSFSTAERAAGEHRARELRQRVLRAEQGLHGASAHRLGRALEDPTRGGVREIDVSLGVEHDDPRQHGIEHTAEIARHGYAARRSRPKYSRVRPRMTSRSWASSACRRNAALPGSPFE